ncbi:MAG: L-2-hydroxyglutarate oxidase, partial [Bacteroidales bacterium]|nr:L-2-hydroxyglutarate oxidase [Bacteroidales bacterium]
QKKYPGKRITIIEKESEVAMHSSGRNSGVLHAGFYYSADSLKAKFCKAGCKMLTDYCEENNLQINKCGKLVVAKNESELASLFELEKRGKKNKVDVKIINVKELIEIEPNAKTHNYALYSPTTATVDPVEVCFAIMREITEQGVKINFNESYKSTLNYNVIITNNNNLYQAGIIINTAGLYADKIAKDFGFSENYTIIPFKGIYLKYTLSDKPVNINVYPVPNLKNPFLGVHFTVTVDGTVKIGPTSIPAFWRENYNGIDHFKGIELFSILGWESKLFLTNAFGFRSLAMDEVKKYNKKYFVTLASGLVKNLDSKGFNEWTKPGIRAQLLDKRNMELVQDFVIEADKKSIHVLNSVSPAFTSCFPFAEYVVDNYIKPVVRVE